MSMVPCAAPALPLTRQPRQSLPCADLALLLTRQPRQSLPCAAPALPLTRQPRQSHPVRRLSPPAHGAASAVPSRTQTWPSCSRNSLGSPIPCADLAFLLTRQPRQSLPCAAPALLLTGQPRQSLPCADLAFLLTRRIKIRPSYVRGSFLRTRGLWNPFLSPGRIAGHSRVALWPYCHLHEEFRLCWQTEIGAE